MATAVNDFIAHLRKVAGFDGTAIRHGRSFRVNSRPVETLQAKPLA